MAQWVVPIVTPKQQVVMTLTESNSLLFVFSQYMR